MTDNVDRNIHRFRFTTDYGEVYAVAVFDEWCTISGSEWKVGFAFCSPEDRWKSRKLRAQIGYDLAESRVRNGSACVSFAEPCVTGMEWKTLRDVIVDHLLRATIRPWPENGLGVCTYGGRRIGDFSNGDFMRWFRGKFAEQFRERYAGGE